MRKIVHVDAAQWKLWFPGNEKILSPLEKTSSPIRSRRLSTTWSWSSNGFSGHSLPDFLSFFSASSAWNGKLYAPSHVRLHLGKQKFLLAALWWFICLASKLCYLRIYPPDTFCRICADCNRWSVNVQILPEIFQPSAATPENKTCSGHYQRTTAIPVQWQHKRYKSILQIALGYFSVVPVQAKLLRLVLFLRQLLLFFSFCFFFCCILCGSIWGVPSDKVVTKAGGNLWSAVGKIKEIILLKNKMFG